jgi:hypothetical protein
MGLVRSIVLVSLMAFRRRRLKQSEVAMTSARPTCAIELVTPEMAKDWLGKNHQNRKLADAVVRRLAGALARGEWMISTDAIGLDSDDGVVNGQHRLQMVIEADSPVEMLVLRNVDPDVIKVIDQGVGRNFVQLLQMDGRYTNAPVIDGAVKWLYRTINGFEKTEPTAYKPTTIQLLELFEQHPNVVGSVDPALEVSKVGVNRGIAAGIHYQCASVDPDAAGEFFDRLASGLDVEDGDPVYALREKVLANAKRENKEPTVVVGAWVIKAWEATRRGETLLLRNLKWVHTGSKAEPYPKISDVPWMVEDTASDDAAA